MKCLREVLRISRGTLIKDIDYQMNIAKKIDRELENEIDDFERERLIKRKNELVHRE